MTMHLTRAVVLGLGILCSLNTSMVWAADGTPFQKATLQESAWETDDNTLAHWDFNSVKNDTIKDKTLTGHTLNLQDNPDMIKGQFGKAIQLYRNYLSVNNYQDLCPSTICVEALVRLEDFPEDLHGMVVANATWTSDNYFGYELRFDQQGRLEFIIGTNDGWKSAITSEKLERNQWYRIAGQFDGKALTVVVDDEIVARKRYSGAMNPCQDHGMNIGRRVKDRPLFFLGSIDEVRISDTIRYN